jgi:formate C-acetyltransferase
MNAIKKIIKKTYLFQLKKSLDDYFRRLSFEGKLSVTKKIDVILQYKVIRELDTSNESKINQIEHLLEVIEIDTKLKNGYFYSIDEMTCLYNSRIVIDNMPCNYDYFIKNSLNAMKTMGCIKSRTTNERLIEAIKKYIMKASKQLSESNNDDVAKVLLNMIDEPAHSLKEALQRILFWNQLLWQTNHRLVGIGRLDKYIDQFANSSEADMHIKNFLLTLHENYIYKSSAMPGDTGQVIVLGGNGTDQKFFCNKFTYLILESVIDLNLPDPKVVLRASSKMPDELVAIAVRGIKSGIGSPLLSNDDVVIPALQCFNYDIEDSHDYAVSACWEPLPSTDALEQNNILSFDFGEILVDVVDDYEFVELRNIEEFFELFKRKLQIRLKFILEFLDSIDWNKDPIMTLASSKCRDTGMIISEGGAKNSNYGFLTVGLASVVNSIINVDELAFKLKTYNLKELRDVLKSNYDNENELIRLLKNNRFKFGSDSEIAIYYTNKIIGYLYDASKEYINRFGGKLKFGLSSPAYINAGKNVPATLDGRLKGEVFATHISNDKNRSITEIIIFSSKLNYEKNCSNGNVVDIMVQPNFIFENEGKFIRFLKSSLKQGFFQLQFNVLDVAKLIDAKANPNKYPNLIVRVWGFSAYFNDLPDDYKDVLINRAMESEKSA